MPFLTPADLLLLVPDLNTDQAQQMIDDAEAMATLAAPCILDEDFPESAAAAVKAIIRGAVVRWHEAGSGAVQSQTAGPYGMVLDTRQQRRGMYWPSEIVQLQRLCRTSDRSAFSINQVPATAGVDWQSRPDLWFQWVFPVPSDAP